MNSYTNGHLTETRLSDYTTVFWLCAENSLGQPTEIWTEMVQRIYGYTPAGIPTRRRLYNEPGILLQDFEYTFDSPTGNLYQRKDNIIGMTETFSHDTLNRVTSAVQALPQVESGEMYPYEYGSIEATYDKKGNVLTKSGITMGYANPDDPYQNTSATKVEGDWIEDRLAGLDAGMTSFDRPAYISVGSGMDGDLYASYDYNASGDKVKGTFPVIDVERIYLGGVYEKDTRSYEEWNEALMDMIPRTETIQRLFLGGTAYDAPMVLVKIDNGAWTPYIIGRDMQGRFLRGVETVWQTSC